MRTVNAVAIDTIVARPDLTRALLRTIVNHMVNYSQARPDPVFAALSDPTRRAILAQLAQGEACVSELAGPHQMSLPAISKHLTVLEKAGLIAKRKTGRTVHCRLDPAPLKHAADWLADYERFWTDQFDALEDYLDNDNPQENK